ncbi:MAG: aminoacyl-tRNA hydrolase [Oscillospiraceae bacterium]|nr:aminoacyl-tRNA hydrolase [Oscillospiraceae bacterium]MBR7009956.1 aminoacyl-tRNA hydrolase [Oscillospiraceae bacterium]
MLFNKPSIDWLIVGLGNPGREYERTRHNVGWRTAELLAKEAGVRIDRVRFRGLARAAELAGQRVLLLKPETYMNNSGEAVQLAAMFYKLPISHILVISDDISLPVGKIRVRAEGSAGGHNGLKSVISHLGSQDFPRIKIGVGAKPHPDYDLADWVLSGFTPEEEKALAPALEHAAAAAQELIRNGVQSAASKYNGL